MSNHIFRRDVCSTTNQWWSSWFNFVLNLLIEIAITTNYAIYDKLTSRDDKLNNYQCIVSRSWSCLFRNIFARQNQTYVWIQNVSRKNHHDFVLKIFDLTIWEKYIICYFNTKFRSSNIIFDSKLNRLFFEFSTMSILSSFDRFHFCVVLSKLFELENVFVQRKN